MAAQNLRVETIAHNIANVNTPSFKRSRLHFEDLLYQTVRGSRYVSYPGVDALGAVQVGRGVRVVANSKVFSQGPVELTSRDLDVAIEGDGFLVVELPDGQFGYTRDGSLSIAAESGLLVTRSGYPLSPAIVVPPDTERIVISEDGTVTAIGGRGQQEIEIGRIQLARFVNPEGLLAIGQNLYMETAASGPASLGLPQELGFGRLIQGALEGSNVEIVQEMVDMISALRAYELNSRSVQTADQMMEQASGLVR